MSLNIKNHCVISILIVYLFGILGRYFHRKAEAWDISNLNGLFGGIFGGAKGALWSGIVMLLLTKQKLLPALKTRKGSYFAKEILDATETLLKALDNQTEARDENGQTYAEAKAEACFDFDENLKKGPE